MYYYASQELLHNIKLARATLHIECKFLHTVQGSRCATIAMFYLGACAALGRVYNNVAIETFLLFITLARTVYCAVHFTSNYIINSVLLKLFILFLWSPSKNWHVTYFNTYSRFSINVKLFSVNLKVRLILHTSSGITHVYSFVIEILMLQAILMRILMWRCLSKFFLKPNNTYINTIT